MSTTAAAPPMAPPPAASAHHVGRARLPTELLLQIIQSLLPARPAALVPPSHPAAQTLLALARVSRATYGEASKLLRRHCVYLDSDQRLARLLACLPRLSPSLPPVPSLRQLTSLYLAPFGSSLADEATAMGVGQLLAEVSGSLRRLVVQMPFASLDPVDDQRGIRRTLRRGFEQLAVLEEFACLGDYPSLSVSDHHTDVWRLWPKLRRLALFGVPSDSHWLWWDIATLPQLQHVVLARPRHLASTNIKDQYFHKLPRADPRLGRKIKLTLLDAAYQLPAPPTARWRDIDPGGLMTVELYELPLPPAGEASPQALVTDWAKRRALDGTLWHRVGSKLGP